MRKQFEEWYARRFAGGEVANMPLRPGGEYVSTQAQVAWFTWEASRAAALEEAAKVCEGLPDAYARDLERADFAEAVRALKEKP